MGWGGVECGTGSDKDKSVTYCPQRLHQEPVWQSQQPGRKRERKGDVEREGRRREHLSERGIGVGVQCGVRTGMEGRVWVDQTG